MPRKTPALKTLLPAGPITFFPRSRGEDVEDGAWIVGVALDGSGTPIAWRDGAYCGYYCEIAQMRGKTLAKAMAEHLRSLGS